jgi:hypothetical protein
VRSRATSAVAAMAEAAVSPARTVVANSVVERVVRDMETL